MSPGSAYPCEGEPGCFPTARSPGISQTPAIFEGRLEAGKFAPETTEYLWPNEQGLPTPTTDVCAGPQAFVGFPFGAVSPSAGYPSPLSTCTPTVFVGSSDGVAEGGNGGKEHDPIDHVATTSANLEGRFEMILNTCKAAGFQSIDSMVAEYYTATFPRNSYLAATQSHSRSRNLPELLDSLHMASSAWDHQRENPWTFNESEKFRETILRLATRLLIDELRQMERATGQAAGVAPPAAEACRRSGLWPYADG